MDFYGDWFGWVEKRAPQIARQSTVRAAQMMAGIVAIVQGDVALFEGLGKAARGGFLGSAVGLATWAAQHSDPLKATREAMRALRLQYGEVAPDSTGPPAGR